MKGINLSLLEDQLHFVAEEHDKKPVLSIENLEQRPIVQEMYQGDVQAFAERSHDIPERYASNFTLEERCKCNFSSIIMPSRWLYDLFEKDPKYRVIQKIRNSMWRYSVHSAEQNETVQTYEALRNFKFSELGSDFDVRLDYSTGCNKKGYSEFSRTFLDGVFAFLLYYKGKHVMTISFSFYDPAHILLQQVQLTQSKGNRWLYKFPENRLEYVLSEFRHNFRDHHIMLVKGNVLVNNIVSDYRRGVADADMWIGRYLAHAKQAIDEDSQQRYLESADRHKRDKQELLKRIQHLIDDKPRLVAFYDNVGVHVLREPVSRLADSYRLVA